MTDLADLTDPELEAAVWDLEPLVDGAGDDGAQRLLAEVRERSEAFASTYEGRVGELDAEGLIALAGELAAIRDLLDRAHGYAALRGYADSADPASGALQGAAEAARATVDARLLFFDLEWIAIADDRAEELLASAGERLDFAAHHLRRLRALRPYLLGPELERILAETSVQRLSAWKRLYTENTAGLMMEVDSKPVPLSQFWSLMNAPDRDLRMRVMAAAAEGAEDGLATRIAVYNQVSGEKAVDDRLRGYPTWLSSRNLANEASDASVQAQLDAIAARQDIPRRWNRIKAQFLGLDRLATSDLHAPLTSGGETVPYAEARRLITHAWSGVSDHATSIVDAFFSGGRVDATIRPGKTGGALSAGAGPNRASYILVNYDSRPTDVMALAHELGHGLHHELARARGGLQHETSMPMAEVASTFSEAVVSEGLMAEVPDARQRLGLLGARLDDAMLNVFETPAWMDFEATVHAHRRRHGEMSGEELSGMWSASLGRLWEDTVEIESGYRLLWSTLPHMVWEPGYLYSYSYGLLTAWSAFARYKQVGTPFAEDYLAMLAAGGSRSPQELVTMIGLDVEDPGFWNAGLDLLDAMVDEAEALAAAL